MATYRFIIPRFTSVRGLMDELKHLQPETSKENINASDYVKVFKRDSLTTTGAMLGYLPRMVKDSLEGKNWSSVVIIDVNADIPYALAKKVAIKAYSEFLSPEYAKTPYIWGKLVRNAYEMAQNGML